MKKKSLNHSPQVKLLQSLRKAVRFWGPFVLWAAVIFLFSSMPTSPSSQFYWQDFLIKKTAHLIEYGVFAMLLYRALKAYNYPKKHLVMTVLFASFLYGVSDEFHQSFTFGREPTVRDVIIDTIGAGISLWIITRLLPVAPPRLKKLAEDYQLL